MMMTMMIMMIQQLYIHSPHVDIMCQSQSQRGTNIQKQVAATVIMMMVVTIMTIKKMTTVA